MVVSKCGLLERAAAGIDGTTGNVGCASNIHNARKPRAYRVNIFILNKILGDASPNVPIVGDACVVSNSGIAQFRKASLARYAKQAVFHYA